MHSHRLPTEGEVNEHGRCEACEEASGVVAREDAAAEAMASEIVENTVEAVEEVRFGGALDTQGTQTSSESSWTLLTLKTWEELSVDIHSILNVAIAYDDNPAGST